MARFRIIEDLQYALQVDPEDPEGEILEVVHEDYRLISVLAHYHLHLGRRSWESETERVLLDVLRGLEDLFRVGSPKDPGKWAKATLEASMASDTQLELGSIIRGLGLENRRIRGEPRYRDLARAFRDIILSELEPKVTALVALWKANRVFEDAIERHKRRTPVDPQVRRDRALQSRFTPPGRA